MKSTAPSKWQITFEPSKIDKLTAGSQTTVSATIQADKKAFRAIMSSKWKPERRKQIPKFLFGLW
jgi:hypothetical protein